jgi:hypothetical protein
MLRHIGSHLAGARAVLSAGAAALILSLGGSSRQSHPRQDVLPRLAHARANLEQTFEALDGTIREITGWPDFNGSRARMQNDLGRARAQVLASAATQPERAASRLAQLFGSMGLKPPGTADSASARLALAREIVGRSRLGSEQTASGEKAATKRPNAPGLPSISPYGQQALRLAHRSPAAPQGTVPPRLPKLGHARPPEPHSHGLKATSIRTVHVGRPSETPAQLEKRKLAERSRALDQAARLVHERMRTSRVVPGNVDGIANRVYEELGLAATGTSESAFKDRVRALGSQPGAAGSRTSASASNGAGGASQRGSAPLSLDDARLLHTMAQDPSRSFSAVAEALVARSGPDGTFEPSELWSRMSELADFAAASADEAFQSFGRTISRLREKAQQGLDERAWLLSMIDEVPKRVMTRTPEWRASSERPAVVLDWDGTLDAATGGSKVPMHLTEPREWVVQVLSGHKVYKQYVTDLLSRHAAMREDPNERIVLIQPIAQLLPSLIEAGIAPHIVTNNRREGYEAFIRNQLRLFGFPEEIGVWQSAQLGYKEKRDFIRQELVDGLGLSIAATIGDQAGGDEFPGAEFFHVPSFWTGAD